MAKTKIFLDTNVLISSILTPTGSSAKILREMSEAYRFCVNEFVILETIDVIDRKFSKSVDLIEQFFQLLVRIEVRILPNPHQSSLHSITGIVEESDVPVLTSALSECNILFTLDDDLLNKRVRAFASMRGLMICKPRKFVEQNAD